MFEEATGTLLCSDLFTASGRWADYDGGRPRRAGARRGGHVPRDPLTPNTGSTIDSLAELEPRTLALMHGPTYSGDGAGMLRTLGDAYDERLRAAL